MRLYKVSLDQSVSHRSYDYWRKLEYLRRLVSNKISSESVEILPTTKESEDRYQVVFAVDNEQVRAFEALMPEAIRAFQQEHKGSSVIFQEMTEAPTTSPVVYAEETEGRWTVNGDEMEDILSLLAP